MKTLERLREAVCAERWREAVAFAFDEWEPITNQWCRRKDAKRAQALMQPSLLEQR